MDFKKLLVVTATTLILSACGSDNPSPLGGGVGGAGIGGLAMAGKHQVPSKAEIDACAGKKKCLKDLWDRYKDSDGDDYFHDKNIDKGHPIDEMEKPLPAAKYNEIKNKLLNCSGNFTSSFEKSKCFEVTFSGMTYDSDEKSTGDSCYVSYSMQIDNGTKYGTFSMMLSDIDVTGETDDKFNVFTVAPDSSGNTQAAITSTKHMHSVVFHFDDTNNRLYATVLNANHHNHMCVFNDADFPLNYPPTI